MNRRQAARSSSRIAAAGTGLALVFQAVGLVNGARFGLGDLAARWLFLVLVLILAWLLQHLPGRGTLVLAGLLGAAGAAAHALTRATWSGWLLLAGLDLLLLAFDGFLGRGSHTLWRWLTHLILAVLAGAVPAALVEIEAGFADEEFYVALWAGCLTLVWLALLATTCLARTRAESAARRPARAGLRAAGGLALLACAAVFGVITVNSYQASFYSDTAPGFPGITDSTPFLCGQSHSAAPGPAYDGREVFARLMAAVAANPYKGTPEFGMLALGTHDAAWARAFRRQILEESAEGRFAGAANSVKSTQYEAALRAYYLPRISAAFPDLFSSADLAVLRDWFAAINRRAMTVEWVDWMYALALRQPPGGPYENQENGAGLLAALKAGGLEDASLRETNLAYLNAQPRGWQARFRNTDDAFVYQPEWLNNALFQAQALGREGGLNESLAFGWMLLQMPPDGGLPSYNHPGKPSPAPSMYLAALLLQDPRYIWMAGYSLDHAPADQLVFAQPGVEQPAALAGTAPTQGSCLLYGNSGMPTQAGPLAPDKIVFRSGWSTDSTYLMLNLRFSGWHRYKATGTVTALYAGEPIVGDLLDGGLSRWLPKGRSLFRDKRIPRENLNGPQFPNDGLSLVLYVLTGVGSRWAQDPPREARVLAFETGDILDWAHIQVTGWRGWRQDRWIYFYHTGPIVVVDRASGPSGLGATGKAALTWHLTSGASDAAPPLAASRWRLPVGGDAMPAEAAVLPLADEGGTSRITSDGPDQVLLSYTAAAPGVLNVATVFLPGAWAGAQLSLNGTAGEQRLEIRHDGNSLSLPLKP